MSVNTKDDSVVVARRETGYLDDVAKARRLREKHLYKVQSRYRVSSREGLISLIWATSFDMAVAMHYWNRVEARITQDMVTEAFYQHCTLDREPRKPKFVGAYVTKVRDESTGPWLEHPNDILNRHEGDVPSNPEMDISVFPERWTLVHP
jgi:hypothetical protein